MRTRTTILTILLMVAIGGVPFPAQAEDYRQYKPWQSKNADNHMQVKFLPEARDWERMSVYVPKDATEKALPCIVFFYGGGWGGRVTGGGENFQTLLDHGYVVAIPDYVLGAQQPVPMAIWDGAAAIRYLRANAATYKIDPERIGGMGLSAGGWLLQYLAVSDSGTQFNCRGADRSSTWPVPMVEPHPANADFSSRLVAFVTDWGAGTLAGAHQMADPKTWLGPDDPPMFTCVTIPETTVTKGVAAYRAAGAVAVVAHTYGKAKTGEKVGGKNPGDYGHCLVGAQISNAFTTDPNSGKEITFGERTLQFLDEYVKHPRAAAAPEIVPHGGPVFGTAPVMLRTIHAGAKIHYTLDGSAPGPASPIYEKPVPVKGGVTLKAIVVKPALKPSAAATAMFTAAPCAGPVITSTGQVLKAKVGQPFSFALQARSERPVTWRMSGKVEARALEAVNTNKDSSGIKRAPPWLTLDPKTGVLSGTPSGRGVNVLIVTAQTAGPVGDGVTDGAATLTDARNVIVTAE